ncbi:MAG TPA: DUF4124 domain-containing protein [Burkholderiales bacterium]|jgi:hypothetical protein
MLLLLLLPLCAQAQMYKCVDERGKTQYTDKPQAGCKEAAIKSSPPLSGVVRPRQEDLGADEAGFRRRQLEREAKDAGERRALAQRCARLQREQRDLASGRRIARLDAKGERVYLEDAARDQRLAQLAEQLHGCP